MSPHIENAEAERLARTLAAVTGESPATAVVVALRERLERVQPPTNGTVGARLRRLVDDAASLPVLDDRVADEILGYEPSGLPE